MKAYIKPLLKCIFFIAVSFVISSQLFASRPGSTPGNVQASDFPALLSQFKDAYEAAGDAIVNFDPMTGDFDQLKKQLTGAQGALAKARDIYSTLDKYFKAIQPTQKVVQAVKAQAPVTIEGRKYNVTQESLDAFKKMLEQLQKALNEKELALTKRKEAAEEEARKAREEAEAEAKKAKAERERAEKEREAREESERTAREAEVASARARTELEQQIAALRRENERLQEENRKLKEQVTITCGPSGEVANLKKQLADVQAELKRRAAITPDELEALRKQLADAQAQLDKFKAIGENPKVISEKLEQAKKSEEARQKAEAERKDCEERISKLQKRIGELEAQLEAYNEVANAVRSLEQTVQGAQ